MTFNVYYTDCGWPDSSFINRAWYNERNQTLTLELHGSVYEYEAVPVYYFKALLSAESAGTFYRVHIKNQFGPARRRGPVQDAREVKENTAAAVAPVHVPANRSDILSTSQARTSVWGTDGSVAVPHLPLNKDVAPKVEKVTYAHTIYFTVGDATDEKSHVLQAESMDEAIESMYDLAEVLNQDIDVKGVLVRFE